MLSLSNQQASVRIGLISAIIAYAIWGVFPLFWRLLHDVPALELVCHRIIWSTAFLLVAISVMRASGSPLAVELVGRWRRSSPAESAAPTNVRELWGISFCAAVVISINWLSFIWAVNNGRILESSLGYYIAPLVSVALGVVVMKERLSRWQWISIVVAGIGVGVISITHGSIPWVSLAMACSFAIYGLLKKRTRVPALIGLLMENSVLCIPAMVYLGVVAEAERGSMGKLGWQTDALIIAGGVITVPPLMLFALGVRRVALSTIGMLQYIGPTLQFIIGVEVAGEALGRGRLSGFVLVWIGSLVYIFAAHRAYRRRNNQSGPFSAASIPVAATTID